MLYGLFYSLNAVVFITTQTGWGSMTSMCPPLFRIPVADIRTAESLDPLLLGES